MRESSKDRGASALHLVGDLYLVVLIRLGCRVRNARHI